MSFNLRGRWFLPISIFITSCYYEDIPREPDLSVCLDSDLSIMASSEGSSGCGVADGSISALATGGSGNYTFSIDGGASKQTSADFTNLEGGSYLVIVFDGTCASSFEVLVPVANSTFQASVDLIEPDTECTGDNGTVEVSSSGATGSVSYTLGTETNSTGVFDNLSGGTYTITAQDDACNLSLSATVSSESSISYSQDIVPILDTKCNFKTCHGSRAPQTNLTVYSIVKANAASIKLRTGNGNMPKQPKPGGSLTAEQIQIIACWVDAGAQNN